MHESVVGEDVDGELKFKACRGGLTSGGNDGGVVDEEVEGREALTDAGGEVADGLRVVELDGFEVDVSGGGVTTEVGEEGLAFGGGADGEDEGVVGSEELLSDLGTDDAGGAG